MQRKRSFIVVLLCMVLPCTIKSQNQPIKLEIASTKSCLAGKFNVLNPLGHVEILNPNLIKYNTGSTFSFVWRTESFTAQSLPFFCKKEWQFEKSTHVPFKFRLGSIDYCNMLEGKDGTRYPGR